MTFIFLIFHAMAGFAFLFVDTDLYKPELNPFTGYFIMDPLMVYRLYNWFYSGYFLYLAWRYFYPPSLRPMRPLLWAIAAYASFAFIRMVIEQSPKTAVRIVLLGMQDIQNVVFFGLIAITCVHPQSWKKWLGPFVLGSIVAYVLRCIAHFTIMPHHDDLGVDSLGFYSTFTLHCDAVVIIGIMAAVWFVIKNKWGAAFGSLVLALMGMAVIATAFRRMPMVRAVMIPLLGLILAYWLQKRMARGVAIALVIGGTSFVLLGTILVTHYGVEASQDRLTSIIKPHSQTVSEASNEGYMEDWQNFFVVIQRSILGVGYGNSYSVARSGDHIEKVGDFYSETPLHVGCLDIISRTGILGLGVLLTLWYVVLRSLVQLRGKVSPEKSMVAGGCAAFLIIAYLVPLGAPIMSQLKEMATFGICLGVVVQMVVNPAVAMPVRSRIRRSSQPKRFVGQGPLTESGMPT